MKFCLTILLLVFAIPSQGAPQIEQFTPLALVPGRANILTFSGSDLASASNLWTSIGAPARRLDTPHADRIRFEVACPKVPNGIYALQLSSTSGASDFQLVMVDDLIPQSHHNQHQSLSNAVRLNIPAAVDGVAKSEKADFYSFYAKSGERLSIEVIAHRIGSQMDPVVRVLNSTGSEVAFCDDEPGIWRDARFALKIPLTGEYFIEVHDTGFGGGSNYDYRLRLTREPLIWFTYPLADPSEPLASFEAIGTATETSAPRSPADASPAPGLAQWPSLAEAEGNTAPQLISFPILINGRIQSDGDVDLYRFHANKEDRILFQSQTRSLGSPCDLVLALKNAEGKTLSSSDLNSPNDAALTNRFSDSGDFLLDVRELSGNVPVNLPYRIKASLFQSGVTGSTATHQLTVAPGRSATVKINLVRYDLSGPVSVEIEPKIAGLSLESNLIPEKKNETELKIIAAPTLKPGELLHFKLKLLTGADSPVSFVSTQPALRKSFPLMLQPPSSLTHLLSLSVKSE